MSFSHFLPFPETLQLCYYYYFFHHSLMNVNFLEGEDIKSSVVKTHERAFFDIYLGTHFPKI